MNKQELLEIRNQITSKKQVLRDVKPLVKKLYGYMPSIEIIKFIHLDLVKTLCLSKFIELFESSLNEYIDRCNQKIGELEER